MFVQLKSERSDRELLCPATVFAPESGLDPIMGFCIDVFDKEKY